jgi:hypothetical protein
VYGAVTKLLLYPTYMAHLCGNALLFPTIVNMLLQAAVVWVVAYLSSKIDKTFYALLCDNFGEVAARVIYGLFAAYFLANAVVPMGEQELFVQYIFYDTIPALLVFIPFFFFSIYAGAKGLVNVGRTADICLPIFIICAILIFVMSIAECRFDALLPILKQPLSKVGGAFVSGSFRFNESAVLLMFVGRFKYRKGDAAKITLSYLSGCAVVLLFMAIFYAIYGELAANQPYAIAKLSIFFSPITQIGRVDLFALYALDIVMLFAVVLNIQLCCHCLSVAFGYENGALYSTIVNGILIVLVFVLNNHFIAVNNFFSRWFWIGTLIFAYILPVCCLLLKRGEK